MISSSAVPHQAEKGERGRRKRRERGTERTKMTHTCIEKKKRRKTAEMTMAAKTCWSVIMTMTSSIIESSVHGVRTLIPGLNKCSPIDSCCVLAHIACRWSLVVFFIRLYSTEHEGRSGLGIFSLALRGVRHTVRNSLVS